MTTTVTIEQAAERLRKVHDAHERAERRAVEQLVEAIRAETARGVTVAAAARRAGVARPQVYRWLRAVDAGNAHVPPKQTP